MHLQDAIAAFELQVTADGRAPATVASYTRHARHFAAWLGEQGEPGDVADVSPSTVARFMASSAVTRTADGRPRAAISRNAIRAGLRALFGYLERAGEIDQNPTRLLRPARRAPSPPRGLTPDEREQLLAELRGARTPAGRRDRVLFELLLGAGLRLGSALGLDVEDVHLAGRELRVRTLKGRSPVTAGLPEDLVGPLADLIGQRRTGPVFVGPDGRRIGPRRAQLRFAGLRERAGLPPWVRPHSLRHAYAQAVYLETGDLLRVKEALHHRSVVSAAIYLRACP